MSTTMFSMTRIFDDASVALSHSHESGVSCPSVNTVEVDGGSCELVAYVAVFVGQYSVGGTTYPFWLPCAPIQGNTSDITVARRLRCQCPGEANWPRARLQLGW